MNSKMIADLYLSGKSTRQISRDLNVSQPKIKYHLTKLNIKIRPVQKILSIIKETQLCEEYKSGMSINRLHKEYQISLQTVCVILKRNGIVTRTLRESVCFSDVKLPAITSYLFLYWLGWILTDGWIYIHNGQTMCGLGSIDEDIIIFFRDIISPKRKIYIEKQKQGRKRFFRLIFPITNNQTQLLKDWAVVPRKSLILKPSIKIRSISHRQFIQLLTGMIEGDGSVINTKTKTIYLYSTYSFCSYVISRLGYGTLTKVRTIWRCNWNGLNGKLLYNEIKKSKYYLLRRKWDKADMW